MKVLYILPNGTVKTGGNWVTAIRLADGLKKRGITVDIVELKGASERQLIECDIIHTFHAFHVFYPLIKTNPFIMEKKIVVSFTGTDHRQLQEMDEGKDEIIELLNKTETIIVFHNEAKEELIEEGILKNKVKIIPQSSNLIEIEYKLNEELSSKLSNSYGITFLFAAGIRKVKAPLEVVEMMSSLVEKVQNTRLIIIGPILEKELGDKLKEKIEGKNWVEYLGEVSHKQVQRFISKCDIMLNNSVSEGMSSTLLEAQCMGKPILATDIAGNRAIVTHGVDGYLFKNRDEFEHYATKLIQDSALREHMGAEALKSIKNYSLEEEISLYEKAYRN